MGQLFGISSVQPRMAAHGTRATPSRPVMTMRHSSRTSSDAAVVVTVSLTEADAVKSATAHLRQNHRHSLSPASSDDVIVKRLGVGANSRPWLISLGNCNLEQAPSSSYLLIHAIDRSGGFSSSLSAESQFHVGCAERHSTRHFHSNNVVI